MATKEQWDELKALGDTCDMLDYYSRLFPSKIFLSVAANFMGEVYDKKYDERNCCQRCDGTGDISAPTDPNDHKCPQCDGKGCEDLGGEYD